MLPGVEGVEVFNDRFLVELFPQAEFALTFNVPLVKFAPTKTWIEVVPAPLTKVIPDGIVQE